MILRSLWTFLKSALVATFLYSFLWYLTGHYIKINIKDIIRSCFNNHAEVDAENISLSGYPFKFIYSVQNLHISFIASNDRGADIKFDSITFTSNTLMDSLRIDVDDPMSLSTKNNKFNYSIKWDEGARINFKFNQPILLDVLSNHSPSLKFNYFAYFDSGYNVFDKNLDKIIFISASNKVRLEIIDQEDAKMYDIHAAMDGEGGIDAHRDAQGELSLNTDLIYSKSKTDNDIAVQINKLSIRTERYEFNASGDFINNENPSTTSKLEIDIKNKSNFLNTMENLLPSQLAKDLKLILNEEASGNKKPKNDDVSFLITPETDSFNILKAILF